jgi:hypothetical protein
LDDISFVFSIKKSLFSLIQKILPPNSLPIFRPTQPQPNSNVNNNEGNVQSDSENFGYISYISLLLYISSPFLSQSLPLSLTSLSLSYLS